jgi:predicted nucleic acid-binding protein
MSFLSVLILFRNQLKIRKMKRIVFVVGSGIAIVGLTAFVFAIRVDDGDIKKPASENTTGSGMTALSPGKSLDLSKIYAPNTDINFRVRGKNERPVTKQRLNSATALNDIFDHYPDNWIDLYESVEISAEINGKIEKASASNKMLSKEQKRILHSVEITNNINVLVNYKVKNYQTGHFEDKQLNYVMTVIPEKQAEYNGGYDKLICYFRDKGTSEIAAINTGQLETAFIQFTVTEKGEISDIDLKKTSGYSQIDKLMYELIRDMPKWNPAENSKGEKVSQNFEFALAVPGDGC